VKRVFKIAAILAGIAIIGCNRIDLVAPALISPADGAALYSGLAFIWGTGEEAEEYVIHVWTGSTDVIEDTLTDTTYTMSDSAFSALAYGIYNWAVASKAGSKLEWSESWSFSLTQPGAPKLIAPQDSAVFDTEPPTFIWSSDSLEPDYVIRIFTDTTIDLQDTLADTTYTMSDSVFENLSNGTYNWQAGTVVFNGVLLSETRGFIVDKPPPPLDLDTTYFPFGLGYEWCFERHDWGFRVSEQENRWDKYDTIIVKVIDSFWIEDTLFFSLEESFRDLRNPIRIWNNKIVLGLYWWQYEPFTPNVIDTAYYDYSGDGGTSRRLIISYASDTLSIYTWKEIYWGPGSPQLDTWTSSALRLKTIGPISQKETYKFWSGSPYEAWTKEYRLIRFTTPEGQVYP